MVQNRAIGKLLLRQLLNMWEADPSLDTVNFFAELLHLDPSKYKLYKRIPLQLSGTVREDEKVVVFLSPNTSHFKINTTRTWSRFNRNISG